MKLTRVDQAGEHQIVKRLAVQSGNNSTCVNYSPHAADSGNLKRVGVVLIGNNLDSNIQPLVAVDDVVAAAAFEDVAATAAEEDIALAPLGHASGEDISRVVGAA